MVAQGISFCFGGVSGNFIFFAQSWRDVKKREKGEEAGVLHQEEPSRQVTLPVQPPMVCVCVCQWVNKCLGQWFSK